MQTRGNVHRTYKGQIECRNKSNKQHKVLPGDVTADSIETLPAESSTSCDIWTGEYMDTSKLAESGRPRKD